LVPYWEIIYHQDKQGSIGKAREIITSPHPLSSVLADNMELLLVDKDEESAQQGHRLFIN
jgi:hypothetical protein